MQTQADQIFIRDLRVDAILGIHPHERESAQPVLINASLWVKNIEGAQSDCIVDTVDYHRVAVLLCEHTVGCKARLIEKLTADLVALCLSFDERVCAAQISVEKPNAIANARSTGFTMFRSREDTKP
jgi:dihydroneopterin aldolase